MGLLDRLFKKDPREALERAESLLAEGQPVKALRLAQRAAHSGSLSQTSGAERIVRRAKEALAEAALTKARVAEEAGFPEDAAEWIEAALDHVDDEGRRSELERRAAALLERAKGEAKRRQEAAAAERIAKLAPAAAPADLSEVHLDDHYEMLVSTLDDDVAERYGERPEPFRRAYVHLNEGRPGEALPALDSLAESHPEEPVYAFERGRCHLMLGDLEAARRDLEAVWESFGDEPLDHAGNLSVPAMWAEAMLGLERPVELVERLDEVAVPDDGDQNLCYHYALALLVTERFAEAEAYLLDAMNHFPQNPEFPHQLAAMLHRTSRTGEAIHVLERAIAPSCTPAGCRGAPLHPPSLRSLAGLYLDQGDGLDRVEELLTFLARALGGRLQAQDYLLTAEYHQQRGDEEAAREAAARARELREAAAGAPAAPGPTEQAPPPNLAPRHKRAPL